MEPNPLKDGARHQTDNPVLSNEFIVTGQFISVFSSKYRNTLILGCRNPQRLTVHQQRPRPRV
jgi:hypothetical protein